MIVKGAAGIAAVLILALTVPIASAVAALYSLRLVGAGTPAHHPLASLYVQHGYQLALAVAVIVALKHLVPGDYGLHRPQRKSYVTAALAWGAAFGVLMTLVDHAPRLLAHARPVLDYQLTPRNLFGWLFFEGVYVGPTEEIPFRAMLIPFLAAMLQCQ